MSFDVNPSSRQTFLNLIHNGGLGSLVKAGGRSHQTGCMGCIGIGQAPASGSISLRTVPRNFPGRSGTLDDQVYLCSPETAAAAALTGRITDPRDLAELGILYPRWQEPTEIILNTQMLVPPLPPEEAKAVEVVKGPNIKGLPDFKPLDDAFEVPVLLKMGSNISTDEILKAGSDVLPFRSNIEELSKYAFWVVDHTFYDRAVQVPQGHVVVAGDNYAQGSSREHAALCPRYLGQKAVIAKNYARIGWQNLVNFGIVPLEFIVPSDYDLIVQGDTIAITNLRESLKNRDHVMARIVNKNKDIELMYNLSDRQIEILLAGGLINVIRGRSVGS